MGGGASKGKNAANTDSSSATDKHDQGESDGPESGANDTQKNNNSQPDANAPPNDPSASLGPNNTAQILESTEVQSINVGSRPGSASLRRGRPSSAASSGSEKDSVKFGSRPGSAGSAQNNSEEGKGRPGSAGGPPGSAGSRPGSGGSAKSKKYRPGSGKIEGNFNRAARERQKRREKGEIVVTPRKAVKQAIAFYKKGKEYRKQLAQQIPGQTTKSFEPPPRRPTPPKKPVEEDLGQLAFTGQNLEGLITNTSRGFYSYRIQNPRPQVNQTNGNAFVYKQMTNRYHPRRKGHGSPRRKFFPSKEGGEGGDMLDDFSSDEDEPLDLYPNISSTHRSYRTHRSNGTARSTVAQSTMRHPDEFVLKNKTRGAAKPYILDQSSTIDLLGQLNQTFGQMKSRFAQPHDPECTKPQRSGDVRQNVFGVTITENFVGDMIEEDLLDPMQEAALIQQEMEELQSTAEFKKKEYVPSDIQRMTGTDDAVRAAKIKKDRAKENILKNQAQN